MNASVASCTAKRQLMIPKLTDMDLNDNVVKSSQQTFSLEIEAVTYIMC